MIGRRVQHYQITEKLGEGGMGVVYKATDTRLQRTVALKFLHPSIVRTPEDQERLENEARAAAAMTHPSICTIYEINEHDDQTFIAMEYVDGSTLRDRVLSDHIEIEDALRFVLDIGSGLVEAHNQSLIHRDIKSANIMITRGGRAVIMDFGLARRVGQPRGDERFSSRGTSAYMSPEQARGEGVDQRTDIWSLGVVLYEMLAGQLPFRGDYEQAVIYSILNEAPRPILEQRPEIGKELAAIVEKCLAKDPDDRYQTIDDLATAIGAVLKRRTSGVAEAPPRRRRLFAVPLTVLAGLIVFFSVWDFFGNREAGSDVRVPIAVVDFDNRTGEPALDGLSGMLITSLEQSRRLSVMTRTRMFDVLKSIGKSPAPRIDESLGQQICDASGVGAMVIPTIRKFGDLYTIDLKVLDTKNNRYILTRKADGRGQESIPGLIDQISREIRLDFRVGGEKEISPASIADMTTVDLAAYQSYFKGEERLDHLDIEGAVREFTEAVDRDSTFALAYFRLGYVEWWTRQQGDKAQANVDFAMANLDRIPVKERFLVRALSAGIHDGFDAQIPIFRDMEQRYPDDKEMLFGRGDAEFHTDRYDSAEVYFKRLIAIDPDFERALQHLTWTYLRTNRYDEARAMAQKWIDAAGSSEAHQNLGYAYFLLKDDDRAMASLRTAQQKDPGNGGVLERMAEVYLAMSRTDSSVVLLQRAATEGHEHEKFGAARVLASSVYPYLGRFHQAEKLTQTGLDDMIANGADSSMIVMTMMGKAFLRVWGWKDADGAVKIAESTLSFPERARGKDHAIQLGAVYASGGRVADAATVFAGARDKMTAVERVYTDLLVLTFSGQCDRASAVLDSLMALPQDGLWTTASAGFLVGRCLEEAGDHRGAIRALKPVVNARVTLSTAAMIPIAWYYLGRAHEAVGETEPALTAYRRLQELWAKGDLDLPLRKEIDGRTKNLIARRNL